MEQENLPVEQNGSENNVSSGADEFDLSYLDSNEAESNDDTSEVDDLEDDIEEDNGEESHNKKGGVQKRFNKLTNEKKQAQAEAAQLKAELAEIKRMLEGKSNNTTTQEEQPVKNQPTPRPKLEDFDYDSEAYSEALVDWKLEQRELSKEQEKVKNAEQEKVKSYQKAVEDTVKNYREKISQVKYKDFGEVISGLQGLPALEDDTAQYIMESEVGPDVHYYLGKNPQKWTNLSKLSKIKQIAEINKIENAIKSKKNNFKNEQLADPIQPLKGGSDKMRKTRNLENVEIKSLADYKRVYKRD